MLRCCDSSSSYLLTYHYFYTAGPMVGRERYRILPVSTSKRGGTLISYPFSALIAHYARNIPYGSLTDAAAAAAATATAAAALALLLSGGSSGGGGHQFIRKDRHELPGRVHLLVRTRNYDPGWGKLFAAMWMAMVGTFLAGRIRHRR